MSTDVSPWYRRAWGLAAFALATLLAGTLDAQVLDAGSAKTAPVVTVPPATATASAVPPKASPPKSTAAATVPKPPAARPAESAKPAASAAASAPLPRAAESAPPALSAAPEASGEPAPSALPAPSAPAPEPVVAAPSSVAPIAPAPVAPVPSPKASAAPGEHPAIRAGSPVNLADSQVFQLRLPRSGKSAQQRASDATRALNAVSEEAQPNDVRYELRGAVAVVSVGQTPIVQLVHEDAAAAGDISLEVHAASVVASIRAAIAKEQRRRALAQPVFSVSLLVFFGLIAFYLLRKVGEFAEGARVWIDANGERVLAVRVQKIEVVSPGTVKSTVQIGLSVGKWVAQLGIIYAWLVVALSLFEATRGYTEKLTGFVISPLSHLMTRLVTGLPVFVVLVIAASVVVILVRFVRLFFDAVERGETAVAWLPRDLTGPTSAIVRFGIITGALIFLAPLVSGSTEGPIGRSGAILFAAIGLAATPFLANGMLGFAVVFGRRLRPGLHVEIGAYGGRIVTIGLLELRLEDADRFEVRVPHLYSLRYPLRVLGPSGRVSIEIGVAPSARQGDVRELLLRTAQAYARDARVEVLSADADAVRYRVAAAADGSAARSDLHFAVLEALRAAEIPLGRTTNGGAHA